MKEKRSYYYSVIKKIGGALFRDYLHLCEQIEKINESYFFLFDLLGLNTPDFKDKLIDILLSNNIYRNVEAGYITKKTGEIEEGELKLEKVLSRRILSKEYSTPEERDKIFKREIHRKFVLQYKEIEKYWKEENRYYAPSFHKLPIKICREAISLTPEGFKIDEKKFIEIYGDYLEANDSQTGKLHQEAAEALNRFFGGQVEITREEIDRYFIIEFGIVKPNPKSVNREGYMRLGYRGKQE